MSGMTAPLVWERSGEAFHATALDLDGALRFHLIVEPNGIWWEWTVLRPCEKRGATQNGRSVTRHGAMWDAERVALLE